MLVIHRVKNLAFPLILLLFVIVLSALRLHGSSVGYYNKIFFGPSYEDPNLLFGQIRETRSDEWLVSTPWAIAQVKNGLKEVNTLYLGEQDLTLSDSPANNIWGIFEPQNWSFVLLPLEQAFAFRWWIKAFLLATSSYILFMMLTNNDILVSIMGALSLTFAPFFQWWYSTTATEIASFAILTFIFFLRLVHDRKNLHKIVDSLLMAYFAVCFSLTLYPPFQIPTVFFLLFVGIGYLWSQVPTLSKREFISLLLNLSIVVLIIGSVLVVYYISHRYAFQAIANTVYPGVRQSNLGGNLNPFKALAGFYNIQLLDNTRTIPSLLNYNRSEASSFFLLSFFLLPFYLYQIIWSIANGKHLDFVLFCSLLIVIILLIWGIVGLPYTVAKLLLLNFVDAYRMLFVFGLANHFFIIYYLYRLAIAQTLEYKIITVLYSIGVFIAIYMVGNHLRAEDPKFIGNLRIPLISIVAGIMMLLLLYQKRFLFFSFFLMFTLISTYAVNPLYRGLSPILSNEVSTEIQILHKENPQAVWLGYGDVILGNFLAANGVRVLNGTYYYPDLGLWQRFDPSQRYDTIYNRYAHILAIPSTNTQIEFRLFRPDIVELDISPCSPVLQDLGIKYYVFLSLPPKNTCLSEVDKIDFPNTIVYIFERTDSQ